MNQLVQQLTDNFVFVAAALIALGLGWFFINYLSKYLSKRRQRQMRDQERIATLLKGLQYAGVAKDVFSKPTADWRDQMLRGLRWLFGGAGLSLACSAYASMEPSADPTSAARGALAGIVPVLIGLAHLLFSAMCRNRQGPDFPTRMSYR